MADVQKTLERINEIATELRERLAQQRKRYASKNESWVEAAKAYANYQLKRHAAAIFIRKYGQAGIETGTGRLLAAISDPTVWISQGSDLRSKGKVYIAFPAKLPGTKDAKKANQKSVYVYGSALNYGAVRQPKVGRWYRDRINPRLDSYKKVGLIGARLARSLKRKAYGGKPKRRVEQYIERQKRLEKKGVSQFAIQAEQRQYKSRKTGQMRKTISFKIKSAGVTITRAFNFFQLSSQEQTFLKNVWQLAFNRKYGQLSKIRLSA